MKKLFALLLALIMVFSLVACGTGNGGKPPGGGSNSPGSSQQEQKESTEENTEDPAPEGIDAEYEIFVNGVEEWRPFPGKSGVTFSVSDTYVIACRETSSTISFTGKQVGRSTITATLDGVEKIATVKVKRMVEKEEEEEGAVVPLILDLPGSFYMDINTGDAHDTSYCLTENSCANRYFDEDEARYGWNGTCSTPTSTYDYWEGYGWIETTEDHGWTSAKFENRYSGEDNPAFYAGLTYFREVVLAYGDSAEDNIAKFYTGETEVIAGIECKIYQISTYKYWVEPTYHFCLKYNEDEENIFTVTKYEAPYAGENPLAPGPDAVIHTP